MTTKEMLAGDIEARQRLIEAVLIEQKEIEIETSYGDIEDLLGCATLQQQHLLLKQKIEPDILAVIRDMLLAGQDVDAIAILASELDLIPQPLQSLNVYGRINVHVWQNGEGWSVTCSACNTYFHHDTPEGGDTYDPNYWTAHRLKRPMSHIGTWIHEHHAACVKKNPGPPKP